MNTHRSFEAIRFKFGSFELVPAMRLLAKEGRPIKVGSRALELLVALVESAGHIVTKNELMTKIWSATIVEDTNLRVHICALRRLLGDDGMESRYIVHVARRGYVFVAPLLKEALSYPVLRNFRQEPALAQPRTIGTNLRVAGRNDAIERHGRPGPSPHRAASAS